VAKPLIYNSQRASSVQSIIGATAMRLQVKKQERIRKVRGKLRWSGDLNSMRLD
jgi:hypothetical protein